MTTTQLGQRLGVSAAAVAKIENNEHRGAIRLETLARAANALDCDLVYAIVPRQPLQDIVHDRAVAVARARIARVSTSMALEDQALRAPEAEDALADLVATLEARPRRLWDELDD